MSGTSGDGLDLALCYFEKKNNTWNYKILDAITRPYDEEWKNKLKNAHQYNAFHLIKLHNEYGEFIGHEITHFFRNKKIRLDFIASHGHTIYHQPIDKITFQLGSGATIAAKTQITTISDFRTLDVALGGNGAPLVPIGDEILFGNYDFCLNLGGFSNVSFRENNKRMAFDICPVNYILNLLAKKLENEIDKEGRLGKKGKINQNLLEELNNIEYYTDVLPKSLSREWVENVMLPLLNLYDIPVIDKLRTIYEHIAIQIYNSIIYRSGKNILITGGGAHNAFLMELIKKYIIEKNIIVPDKLIINYKEALIFAFLGVLRMRDEHNCLSSVTGASNDNIGGVIYKIN
ncbi:MAG: anhydro-N-acetylmuramic acid kinase [Bacteroidales bacterium]|nr:anhydro-N-acetylmuramic acid kinase [Bacteroidales bacterium]